MLTNIKGTSATGASLTTLSALTDVLLFSEDYDDFGDLIAQQAAIRLYPQLRGDKDMYAALKKEFQDNLRTFGRRFPRKRVQGQFRHSLRR